MKVIAPGTFRLCASTVAVASLMGGLPAQVWERLAGPSTQTWTGDFDPRRGRFVHFGATDQEVWELSDSSWQRIPTAAPPFGAPAYRSNFAAAFDSRRGCLYLFGGTISSAVGDMWRWDGMSWLQVPAIVTPPRRSGAAMAYDRQRDRLVLYGGVDGGVLTDTWEFDGQGWSQLAGGSPSAGATGPRMVYEAARGRCLLLANGTWAFSGLGWTPVDPTTVTTPSTRMCYDESRAVVVRYHSETTPNLHEWNGSTWTGITLPALPLLGDPQVYYDPALSAVVLSSPSLGGTQLVWDGVTMQNRARFALGSGFTWLHDPVRGNLVAFCTTRSPQLVGETWIWDGRGWHLLTPATSPPARSNAGATFDTVRGLGLVYGGSSTTGLRNDLWGWNGTTWSQLAAQGPPQLVLPLLSFDTVRGRAVLFGGVGLSGPNTQTWEWDGTTWTQITPAIAPSLGLGSMAYDPVRGRTVLYVGTLQPPQTWEWDGAQWSQRLVNGAPSGSVRTASVFDAQHGTIAMAAPLPGFGIWDFDGVSWSRRSNAPAYVVGSAPAMVWDSNRQELVLFDGAAPQALRAVGSVVESYGAACSEPPAVLMVRTSPRSGMADFGFDVAVEPGLVTLFGLSAVQANVALGSGCTLLLGPAVASALSLADARGLASWSLPIPSTPSLVGAQVFAQAGAVRAGGQFAVSQGLRVVVGS